MADSTGEIVVIKRNGSDGSRFPLKGVQCSFGRDPSCNIRIIRTDVEPQHVTLDYGDGKVWLSNLSTSNPAMVNEAVVDAKSLLKDKDVFTIGGRSFRFEAMLPMVPARRKSSLVKTPLGSYQGSPRTPAAREDLKRSITRLEKASDSVLEENEVSSPVIDKENTPPCEATTPVAQGLLKRKSIAGSMSKKRVSFGGNLSPELFDKTLPPNTPLRKGSSPAGRRKSEPISTPPRKILDKKRRSVSVFANSSVMEDVIEEPDVFEEGSSESNTEECPVELLSVVSSGIEESGTGDPSPVTKTSEGRKRMKTPLRRSIERGANLRPIYRKLATPLRRSIHSGRVLRRTKQSLPLDLMTAIEGGAELRVTKKKIATPLRKAILSKPSLRETKKKMRKSLQSEILQQPKLKATKKKMRQSLQAEIMEAPTLKETKKKMRQSLQTEIQNPPQLNETKKRMRKSLQVAILNPPRLNETKKIMRKSLQTAIQHPPKLNEAKKKMRKSLQVAIQHPPKLNETKKKMRKSLQVAIQNPHQLNETKKKMRKSLQVAIQNPPQLNETKKKMRKSLQVAIQNPPQLNETKKKMRQSLQSEIQNPPVLKETKKKMRQSLQAEIISKPALKETKKKMRKSLQAAIMAKPALKETKKKLATPVRHEIESKPKLRQTKKKLGTQLKKEIEVGTHLKTLQERYPVLDNDLQKDIKSGKRLKQVKAERKKALTTPIRRDIESKPQLKKTLKRLKTPMRAEIKKGLALKSIKDRYPALSTEIQVDIKKQKALRKTKLSAPTPLRKQIKEGKKLRKTKLVMRSSLQGEIRAGTLLKQTLKKSLKTPIRKQIVEVAKAKSAKPVSSPKPSSGRKVLKARRRLPPREKAISEILVEEKTKRKKENLEPPSKRQRRGSTPRPIKTAVKSPEALPDQEKFTGISRILKTPKVKTTTTLVNGATGIDRLMKTPKVKNPTIEDFGGVSRIMKTPKVKNTPTEDLAGVARVLKTPKVKKLVNDDLTGVARIMKTPKVKNSPVADLTCLARIMNTPKSDVPATETNNDANLAGIRRLLATPKARKDDQENLECLKDLFETPTQSGPKGEAEKEILPVKAEDVRNTPASSKRPTRRTKVAVPDEEVTVEPVDKTCAKEVATVPKMSSRTRRQRSRAPLTKNESGEGASTADEGKQPAEVTAVPTIKRKRPKECEPVSMKRQRKDTAAEAIPEQLTQVTKTRGKRNVTANPERATRSTRSRKGRVEVTENVLGVIVESIEESDQLESKEQRKQVEKENMSLSQGVITSTNECVSESEKAHDQKMEAVVEKENVGSDGEFAKPTRQTRSNLSGKLQNMTPRSKRVTRRKVESKVTLEAVDDTKSSVQGAIDSSLDSVDVTEELPTKTTRRTRNTKEIDTSDSDVAQSVSYGRKTRGQTKCAQEVDEHTAVEDSSSENLNTSIKAKGRSTKSQTRATRATKSKQEEAKATTDGEQQDDVIPEKELVQDTDSLPTRSRTRKQKGLGSQLEQNKGVDATNCPDDDLSCQGSTTGKPTRGKTTKAPLRATRHTRSKQTTSNDKQEVEEDSDLAPDVQNIKENTPVPPRTRSTRGRKAEKVEVLAVSTRSSRRTRK